LTAPALTHAVVVKLVAKPETAEEVARFLAEGVALANEEAGTPYWFSVRADTTTFFIFDAFPSEADLRDHGAAPFASTLREKTESWFAAPPEVTVATVLGTKAPA
jgi:quinol monooxygenase YgiN